MAESTTYGDDDPVPGDDVPELMRAAFAKMKADRIAKLESDDPIPCDDGNHDWVKDYYGVGCKSCGLWYADDQVPWDVE